jgi:hypothetical protein
LGGGVANFLAFGFLLAGFLGGFLFFANVHGVFLFLRFFGGGGFFWVGGLFLFLAKPDA